MTFFWYSKKKNNKCSKFLKIILKFPMLMGNVSEDFIDIT